MSTPAVRLSELNDLAQNMMCKKCRTMVENLHVVQAAANDLIPEPLPISPVSLDQLRKEICAEFRLPEPMLVGHSNVWVLVRARRAFAKRARLMGFSFPEIGRAIQRHHTSILHLCTSKNKLTMAERQQ